MQPAEIIDIEQGTDEWRKLRAALLTGSRVASALSAGGFGGNPKSLIREMVMEANGQFKHIDAPAMKWGRDNEDNGRNLAAMLVDLDFSDQRFRLRGRYGYSPDGVSEDGDTLLEVKCPYSKREDDSPEFNSIYEMKHYYHQVQFGMWMTGCSKCISIQWAPNGYRVETVEQGAAWQETNLPKLEKFIEQLDARMNDEEYTQALTARNDEPWENAARRYRLAKEGYDDAKRELDVMKETLIALAGDHDAHGCGVKVAQAERKGSIDTTRMLRELNLEDAAEEYRKPASKYWTVKETKTS